MGSDFRLKNIDVAFKAVSKLKNWPTYFLDLFHLITTTYVRYASRAGPQLLTRTGTADRGILTTVVLQDEYKIADLPLPKGATVIDIGGQIGTFSTFIAPKAQHIFTYEPMQENIDMIKKNIALNKLEKKVHAFHLAVSDKKEKIKIYVADNNSGGHSRYGDGDYEEVETTTLASIFKDNDISRCDLLKMDIEGGEYPIFYSAPDSVLAKIERIHMECHHIDKKKNNPKSLIQFLRLKGFIVSYEPTHQIAYCHRNR